MRITREEFEKAKAEYEADDKKKETPRFNKLFKFKKRQLMNKSLKKNDEILAFVLNLKKQIEGPILTKIYGGNFLVIRNQVYRFNPHRVFTFGKYKAVIARQFDRELVGIDDYEDLLYKDFNSKNPGGRVNIDDPVLIKALIAARLSEKQKANAGLMKWIVIGLIIVGVIIGFFYLTGNKNKNAPAVVTPPTTP